MDRVRGEAYNAGMARRGDRVAIGFLSAAVLVVAAGAVMRIWPVDFATAVDAILDGDADGAAARRHLTCIRDRGPELARTTRDARYAVQAAAAALLLDDADGCREIVAAAAADGLASPFLPGVARDGAAGGVPDGGVPAGGVPDGGAAAVGVAELALGSSPIESLWRAQAALHVRDIVAARAHTSRAVAAARLLGNGAIVAIARERVP